MIKAKKVKRTITIRLTEEEHTLLARVCSLLHTSQSAYLAKKTVEHAKKDLLEFAVQKYLAGQASLSELATQTGLPAATIMDAVAEKAGDDTKCVEALLSAAKAISQANNDPEFYDLVAAAMGK